MEIIHVSAECYPVAKAGGMGDVVGALPKYQCGAGQTAKVVMPMHKTKFLYQNEWVVDFKGNTNSGNYYFDYTIIREKTNKLGFDLYLVDIYGLLDRDRIYGYQDDATRFIAFQIAVIHWMKHWQHVPDIIHCHDHHCALIPFMIKNCFEYHKLSKIRTVFTIHNAQYQGWMNKNKAGLLPVWDKWKWGELEWDNLLNPLASGIKCAWKVTTVSKSYLQELRYASRGLENLFEYEKGKCVGILNGIDSSVWAPETDEFICCKYKASGVSAGKEKNKEALCKRFNLDMGVPLVVFIGRLVNEKAADILPDAFRTLLWHMKGKVSFLVTGTGEGYAEQELKKMNGSYPGYFHAELKYCEALSHNMYAGADYLLMPSRVEPCGLNQMYSLRYGTVPIVRSVGGLKDTVVDIGDQNGFGIRFNHATIADIQYSVGRALSLYNNKAHLNQLRRQIMKIEHSWHLRVDEYTNIYKSIL